MSYIPIERKITRFAQFRNWLNHLMCGKSSWKFERENSEMFDVIGGTSDHIRSRSGYSPNQKITGFSGMTRDPMKTERVCEEESLAL